MDKHFNEYVSMSDRAHREAMERGSNMLARAIREAKAGYCPATSPWPVKLPPDWSSRVERVITAPVERAEHRPANDRVREMMALKMSAGEIARALKISHQKASAIMQLVRKQRPPSEADKMRQRALWG